MTSKKSNTTRNLISLLAVILLTALDQLTKYMISSRMQLGEAIPLIKGVFQLRYIRNEGAAWSILEGKQIVFVVLTPIVIFFLAKMFLCLPGEKKYSPIRVITVFLVAGAIGNLIDRIWGGEVLFRGSVVDFFDFCLINYPVFNVADIYVSLSVAALLILMIFKYKEEDFEVIYESCVRFKKKA